MPRGFALPARGPQGRARTAAGLTSLVNVGGAQWPTAHVALYDHAKALLEVWNTVFATDHPQARDLFRIRCQYGDFLEHSGFILSRTDIALYAAKKAGRNVVKLAA